MVDDLTRESVDIAAGEGISSARVVRLLDQVACLWTRLGATVGVRERRAKPTKAGAFKIQSICFTIPADDLS